MAITQRVIMPGKQESGLEKIAKALRIAQSGFGIKTALEQSALNEIRIAEARKKQEQQEFAERGGLTPKEQLAVTEVAPDAPGARTGIRIRDGQEEQFTFKTPQDIQRELTDKLNEAKKIADSAEDEAKKETKLFTRANKLGERFDKASKTTSDAIEGFQKVEAAASNPNPSGATDLALLFGFMKSIDPGSVVRESEFATAQETQPIPERVAVMRDRILSGERLSPEQRARLLLESKRAIFNQLQTQEAITQRFQGIAESFDVPSDLIIDPRFGELAERLRRETDVTAGLMPQRAAPTQPATPAAPAVSGQGIVPQQPQLLRPANVGAGSLEGTTEFLMNLFGGGQPQAPSKNLNDADFIEQYKRSRR